MSVRRPHSLPMRSLPQVKLLFAAMNARGYSCGHVAAKAGMSRNTIINWRTRTSPGMADLEACFNVCGMTLRPVPLERVCDTSVTKQEGK